MLAHGFSKVHFEGRIGVSERLGEIAQIVGLAKLIAALGKDLSNGWHQARLFITEHGKNRPLKLLKGSDPLPARLNASPSTARKPASR